MATPPSAIHLEVVSSTQDEARNRFRGEPVLVTASRQTAGRGRSGSNWVTADRAIAASMAFRPRWDSGTWPLLSPIAGLAASDVLGPLARLKWPNDVVMSDAKVAGILVEGDGETVVVGLGVNLWWPAPLEGAGAIYADDPGADAGPRLGEAWAHRLLERLESGPGDWGRDEYLTRSATVGAQVTWEPDGAGRATGISDLGGLVVETAQGTVVLDSGVVHTVRTAGGGAASE